jgi:transposase
VPISGYSAPRRYDVVAETRRRWSREEKRAIVAEAMRPGVSVSEVARRHGLHSSLLFRWRREFVAAGSPVEIAKSATPRFIPIALPAPAGGGPAQPEQRDGPVPRSSERGHPRPAPDDSAIEIDLRNGRRLRVTATVDTATLKCIIAVLEG